MKLSTKKCIAIFSGRKASCTEKGLVTINSFKMRAFEEN